MRRLINHLIEVILMLVLLGGVVYVFREDLRPLFERVEHRILPCKSPIAYTIGDFDERFGLTRADFAKTIKEAEAIWEYPLKRELFESSDQGSLRINLVYDTRQQTTEKLKSIGVVVDQTQASYDKLQSQYESALKSYDAKKKTLDAQIASYERDRAVYEQQVAYWRERGGAPRDDYERLESTRQSLNARAEALNVSRLEINAMAEQVNTLVSALNGLAKELNLSVTKYNRVSSSQGEEFEEADYTSDIQKSQINIYQFTTRAKLVRVLAHELGHALGVGHVNDPDGIMYRLNTSSNTTLTPDDLALVRNLCDR